MPRMRKTKLAEESSYTRRVRQTRLLTTGKCVGEDGDLLEYLLHVCHYRLHFPLLDTFLPKGSVSRPWSDNQAFICTTLLLEMLLKLLFGTDKGSGAALMMFAKDYEIIEIH